MSRKLWTAAEIKLLKDEYPRCFTPDLAARMGRSYMSVAGMACLMGLKKDEAFRREELQRQGERLVKDGRDTRFKKGQAAHNKGVKMSPDVYETLQHTFFKKGNRPGNLRPVGYERTNVHGYVEVKTASGFRQKHAAIWEAANGPAPKGHNIVFINGDRQDLRLDNLELISKAENMRRNTLQRWPADLQRAIRATNKIKKQITSLQKNKNNEQQIKRSQQPPVCTIRTPGR